MSRSICMLRVRTNLTSQELVIYAPDFLNPSSSPTTHSGNVGYCRHGGGYGGERERYGAATCSVETTTTAAHTPKAAKASREASDSIANATVILPQSATGAQSLHRGAEAAGNQGTMSPTEQQQQIYSIALAHNEHHAAMLPYCLFGVYTSDCDWQLISSCVHILGLVATPNTTATRLARSAGAFKGGAI